MKGDFLGVISSGIRYGCLDLVVYSSLDPARAHNHVCLFLCLLFCVEIVLSLHFCFPVSKMDLMPCHRDGSMYGYPCAVPILKVPLERYESPVSQGLLTITASCRLMGLPCTFFKLRDGSSWLRSERLPQAGCYVAHRNALSAPVTSAQVLSPHGGGRKSHIQQCSQRLSHATTMPICSHIWGQPGSAPSIPSQTQEEERLPFFPRVVT